MKNSILTAFTILFYSATLVMGSECLASASLNRVASGNILQMQANWQKEIQENPSIKKLIEDQEGLLRTLPKRGESSTPVSEDEIAYIKSLKLECLAPEQLRRLQPHQGGSSFTAEQAANLREVVKKSIETKWNGLNEKYPLSPTQVHLKLALGSEYIDGNSLAALKQNIETFIKKAWPPSMWDQKAIEKLAELFEFELEEYKKGNLVMYHGLGGAFLSFYQYISSLHALLKGERVDDFGGLRGNHLPFINKNTGGVYENIFEMYDVLGCEDYKDGIDTLLLFVNPIMTLNKPSSLSLFFGSSNFNISSAKNFMLEMLVSLGMPIALAQQCYDEWESLYRHFYQSAGGSRPNSGMLAVSIPADLSRTHTLLADTNGNPYAPCESEIDNKSITPSIIQMIQNLQEEAGKKPEERRDLRNLTSEARIYLDPTKKFEVRGAWHYDLDEKQKQEFEQCWNTMIKAHMSRLLKSKKLPVEYSLIGLDSNDSLITKAQKVLGKFSQQQNVLPILIANGSAKAIDSFLDLFPASLDPNSVEIKQAFSQAILSNHNDNHHNNIVAVLDKHLAKLNPPLSAKNLLRTEDKQYIASNAITLLPSDIEDAIEFLKTVYKLIGDTVTPAQKKQVMLTLSKRCQHEGIPDYVLTELLTELRK